MHFQRMKAARETSRSLAGTTMYDCLRLDGMTSDWLDWASGSSLMLTRSGSFSVRPASFSTPALSVADTSTVWRLPKPPSFSKCSSTVARILRGINIESVLLQKHLFISNVYRHTADEIVNQINIFFCKIISSHQWFAFRNRF